MATDTVGDESQVKAVGARDAKGKPVQDGDLVTFTARVLHVNVREWDNKVPDPGAFRVVAPDGTDIAGPVFKCGPELCVRKP